MNKTVLDTIRRIRGGKAFHMSARNQNVYRVLMQETDSQTAYYFNTPVYRPAGRAHGGSALFGNGRRAPV